MALLKRVVGNLLRRVGYQAIASEALATFNLSLHLKKLITSQAIDTVWDVGANRGQFYQFLRGQVGYSGVVLSFEPISALHDALKQQSQTDGNWHVFPFALGEVEQEREINVMTGNEMSSFLQPDDSHTQRFRNSNTIKKTEVVQIKRLDDVYQELKATYSAERSYLKLDTQGFDLEILKGGQNILGELVALQTEAVVLPLYKDMPDYRETIAYLTGKGFELSGVFPITQDERLRLIEFDCIMVNTAKTRPITE
jgi:FkbM family methyltransferase